MARPAAVTRPSVKDYSGWWKVAHDTCPFELKFWSKKKRLPGAINSNDFTSAGASRCGGLSLIFAIAIFSASVVSGWARAVLPVVVFGKGNTDAVWVGRNSEVAGPKK